MCFENDAKTWSLSSDVRSLTVEANSAKYVDIYGNFWADFIAISYLSENTRYIVYAKDLNIDTFYMNVNTTTKQK